jgi:hypothetical protein
MPDGSADVSGASHKDELADILSPNFNLESMVSQTGRLEVKSEHKGSPLTSPFHGIGFDTCVACLE